MTLPLDAYLLTLAQTNATSHAQYILIRKCMAAYGYNFIVPTKYDDPTADPNQTRYGITLGLARKYGYHDPDTLGGAKLHEPGTSEAPASEGVTMSAVELLFLSGPWKPGQPPPPNGVKPLTQTSVNGVAVPDGGCSAQTDKELSGGISGIDVFLAQTLAVQSALNAERDPRELAVQTGWRNCMASHGYSYKDFDSARSDRRWQTINPTTAEIQTALTDVACKDSVHYVQVASTVETEYQNALIEKNATALADLLAYQNAKLANAARILGSATPSG